MKKFILSMMVFAAASVFAADSEENLYKNSAFKTTTGRNGKIVLYHHWYEGTVSTAGKYRGNTAVKLESVHDAGKGCNAAIVTDPLALPPGKYCVSVWCKIEGDGDNIRLLRLYHRYSRDGKRHDEIKIYQESDKPGPEKWTELARIIEIGKGQKDNCIIYGFYSGKPGAVCYAAPKISRCEDEN